MLSLINDKIANNILKRYYSQLEKTGYVKETSVKRMLVYLFLIDFVDNTFWYLEDKDYTYISRLMNFLFSNGDCLLPYPVFCTNRAVLGRDGEPMRARLRITEDLSGNIDRITEDDELREAAI